MRFSPAGYCIYCGKTERLTDEHIIPFGLSGMDTLPDASCVTCAATTSRCERVLLRGQLQPVRLCRQLRSRRDHKNAPQDYPLTVIRDGASQQVRLPLREHPILVNFPLFTPAASYEPRGYVSGIRVTGITSICFGRSPTEVARDLGAQQVIVTEAQQPVEFARLLAKIALGYAAASGALGRLKDPSPVAASVLGRADEIGRWVGTSAPTATGPPGALHAVALRQDREAGLLVVDVQLFSDSLTPLYHVVLGELE